MIKVIAFTLALALVGCTSSKIVSHIKCYSNGSLILDRTVKVWVFHSDGGVFYWYDPMYQQASGNCVVESTS